MSLLEELGLDPAEFEWHDLALCKSMPFNTFYEDYESDVETAKAVDELCLRCPVMKECFFTGSQSNYGVWGGVYWNGSGKKDNNKNAHKTDETWEEIYDRVANDEE